MIRIKVGLALRITDGYTGEAVSGKGLLFFLDGVQKAMIEKPGGFYALTGVEPGEHKLRIESVFFRTECFSFEAGTELIPVILKPGPSYPHLPGSRRIRVRNEGAAAVTFYTGRKRPGTEIKIAQSDLSEGDRSIKLYFGSKKSCPELPCRMLIEDGAQTEAIFLEEKDGDGKNGLGGPLTYAHKRGCLLMEAQRYILEGAGKIEILYPGDCEELLFVPDTGEWIDPSGTEEVVLCGKEDNGKQSNRTGGFGEMFSRLFTHEDHSDVAASGENVRDDGGNGFG